MTRILSVFKFLKRVGFAFLVLGDVAYGQPDSLWTQFYSNYPQEGLTSVIQTTDSGFLITGQTWVSVESGFDGWLIKTDPDGDTVWTRFSRLPGSDSFLDVVETEDGYWVIGVVPDSLDGGNDAALLSFSSLGELQWMHRYSWRRTISVEGFVQLTDGSFVFTGNTTSEGDTTTYAHLTKLSRDGVFLWTREYIWEGRPAAHGAPFPKDVAETENGGFVMAGLVVFADSGSGIDQQACLLRADSTGNLLWKRDYGGVGDADVFYSVISFLPFGGIVASGTTGTTIGWSDDFYVVRLDTGGDVVWVRTLGWRFYDEAFDMTTLEARNVLVMGIRDMSPFQNDFIWLVKLDELGEVVWDLSIDLTNPNNGSETAHSVRRTLNGGFVIGAERSILGDEDLAVIRLGPDITSSLPEPGVPLPQDFALSVFPNPFNSTLRISLDAPLHSDVNVLLYDLLGREVDVVYRGRVVSNTISYAAPAGMASGVYFLKAESRGVSVMRKVVLLR